MRCWLTRRGKPTHANRKNSGARPSPPTRAALKKFTRATELQPSMHEAWNYLGYSNRKLGRYDAALSAYERALTLKPGYAEALEYRGHAYLGLNRLGDAKDAYLALFASNRKLAASLLAGMQQWVGQHRAGAGVDPGSYDSFASWVRRAQRDRQPDRGAHARRRGCRLEMTLAVPHSRARSIAGVVTLLVTTLAAALTSAQAAEYRWTIPPGLPQPAVPADNPMSDAKVALGRALFSDVRLSISGQLSCQGCHEPSRAFTDGLARSRGALQDELPLNAPTLLNVAYNPSLGWNDPSVRTLEQQMRGPLFNEHPRELGLAGREWLVERKLAADPDLVRAFQRAFPREAQPVTMDNVIRAIAAFERTLLSANSAFDRYVFRGEHEALDAMQKRGMELFFSPRAGCSACHGGINFAGPWVDREPPGSRAGVRGYRDWRAGARAHAAQPGRHGSIPARRQTADARCRARPLREGWRADPAADHRLRRPALTTGDRAALLAFLQSLDTLLVLQTSPRTLGMLRRMSSDYGRHVLLAASRVRARRHAGARPGGLRRGLAPERQAGAALPARGRTGSLAAARAAAGCPAPTASGVIPASRLSSDTPGPAITGSTTSLLRVPGPPITSVPTAKAWRRS